MGDERLWSSYPEERDTFGDKLISMSVKVPQGAAPLPAAPHNTTPRRLTFALSCHSPNPKAQEFDDNHDGKPDVITVTGTASGAGMPIHSAKVLLDFNYTLQVRGSCCVYLPVHSPPLPSSPPLPPRHLSLLLPAPEKPELDLPPWTPTDLRRHAHGGDRIHNPLVPYPRGCPLHLRRGELTPFSSFPNLHSLPQRPPRCLPRSPPQ